MIAIGCKERHSMKSLRLTSTGPTDRKGLGDWIKRVFEYDCTGCGKTEATAHHSDPVLTTDIVEDSIIAMAQSKGWMVSKSLDVCFCPACLVKLRQDLPEKR